MKNTHIDALLKKHDDLKEKIRQERAHPSADLFTIRRMEKQKLFLKDEIEQLKTATG